MKNDFFEESEDEFENYENEYSGNIEMVVEEAEGLQVLTTYDSNGYVVDARVCSSEEIRPSPATPDPGSFPAGCTGTRYAE